MTLVSPRIEHLLNVDVTQYTRVALIPYFYLQGELWFGFIISTCSGKLSTVGGQVEPMDFNGLTSLYRERDEEVPNFPLDPPEIIGRNDCIVSQYQLYVFQEVEPDLVWYNQYNLEEVLDLVWLRQDSLSRVSVLFHHQISPDLYKIYELLQVVRPQLGQNGPPINYDREQLRELPRTVGDYQDLLTDLSKKRWYQIFTFGKGDYSYLTGGDRTYQIPNSQRTAAIDKIFERYGRIKIITVRALFDELRKKKLYDLIDDLDLALSSTTDPVKSVEVLYQYRELEYKSVGCYHQDPVGYDSRVRRMRELGESNKMELKKIL